MGKKKGLLKRMKLTLKDYYILINDMTYLKMKNPQIE